MNLGFTDPLFETWAQRTLLNIADGGCEIGEVAALAARIPSGDRDAWYHEWCALGQRLFDQAEKCNAAGHTESARGLYQRASTYFRTSYPLLYGQPADPRVGNAYRLEALAFQRAAAHEHRLAALVADPGQWDMLDAMRGMFNHFGAHELATKLPNLNQEELAPVAQAIHDNPALRWTIEQRGFWVHGVSTLQQYLQELARYTLSDHAHRIQCPTLVTQAGKDPIAQFATRLYDAVQGPKKLITFTEEEGAGGHCETLARSVYHQRVYDWLDETLNHSR